MGAPATQGKLCTSLNEMQIGDYIRCTYTATAGAAGDFSDLGGLILGTMELPLSPTNTPNGYFYFLKAAQGLLIADRLVQSTISWSALNLKKYIFGNNQAGKLFRILADSEWVKYITNGDLDGKIIKQDKNVWHGEIVRSFDEFVQNANEGSRYTKYKLDNSLINDKFHLLFASNYWTNGTPCYTPATAVSQGNSTVDTLDVLVHTFRPALEYIDNKKSKTLWY